jgi:hypothetical protein
MAVRTRLTDEGVPQGRTFEYAPNLTSFGFHGAQKLSLRNFGIAREVNLMEQLDNEGLTTGQRVGLAVVSE